MFARLACAALVLVSLAVATGWTHAGEAEIDAAIATQGNDANTFRAAFDALQFAVRTGDAATVAAFVHYPSRITVDGERLRVDNEADFLERYIDLIVEGVGETIVTQDYGSLLVTEAGVVFGEDEVRMKSYCTDRSCAATYWLITAINLKE